MRILYGIQATGNGHVSRSREVIKHLKDRGHEVRVVLSGKDADRLKNISLFYPCDIFQGLTFSTFRGKLQTFKTATRLRLFQFFRDISSYNEAGFDLVISDFEPLTTRIADRFSTPSIGIGHQYAFCYNIPVAGANPLTRWVLQSFAPVDYPIGLHWHHFNQPILPPIIPANLNGDGGLRTNKILVYLPFEHPEDIEALIEPFTAIDFFVYGIPHLNEKVDQGNLHLRPFSRSGLLADLGECNGVISNAGFELISEALQLGKKVLVKPLSGQLEQSSNALAVTQLRLGVVMSELCSQAVESWLHSSVIPAAGYPDVAGLIAQWVEQGDWLNIKKLSALAWERTANLPDWNGAI